MAVNFRTANSQTSTVQEIYTVLHAVLILAGWELVYADADAIGTGSAANPAWSKAPAINTTAGTVIYRMPAVSGFATRWYIEVKALWGNTTTAHKVQVRSGLDVASGSLTSAGAVIEAGNASNMNPNANSAEWYVSAFEHGFLLALPAAQTGFMMCIERRRRLDDTMLDDLTTLVAAVQNAGVIIAGSSINYGVGTTRSRLSQGAEIAPANWALLKAGSNPPATLNRMDGATGIPAGPLSVSGGMAGFPRLFMFLCPNDAPPTVDLTRFVDGANHAYLPATSLSHLFTADTAAYRLCIAKD